MTWQIVDEWRPFFALLPVMTVRGNLVWLRRCEVRTLQHLYNDGHDHRRDKWTSLQFRVDEYEWQTGAIRKGEA